MKLNSTLVESIRQPISTAELERRWAVTRKAMATQGIDCLVMQNSNQYLGGYVRWFTDIPAQEGYPVTVIFPVDDEMTMITSGGAPLPPGPPEWAVRGVRERIGRPYFRTLNYTNTMDAEAVVSQLKARGAKKVGIVAKGSMSAPTYEYIQQNRGQMEIVEVSDLIDPIKAVKSPEELELIKKTAAIQDAAMAAIPAIVRPGKKEYEIISAAIHMLMDMGSEEQLLMIGSAPPGKPTGQRSDYYTNRTLEPGDQLFLMIEVNGPGGFYAELGRTFCLGEPPKELLDVWEVAKEAQRRTVERLIAGARPADLLKAHNEFMTGKGFGAEGRLFGHGQGYDLVERPALRADENMPLATNMNIVVHPIAVTDKAYGFCCDNYIVGDRKAMPIHKTPQEVLVL
ncbi:MAG TPA: M24 family metallopeptidase [Syntrophorhabdales bacterium]|nr:M24 family metallopeptidase [Syntrophorhabdales bacterium]